MGEAVQLRAWAERLLLGESLDDKLWSPAALSDTRPGPAMEAPRGPGRGAGLRLSDAEGIAMPRDHALSDPQARGLLLHAFANHELLAIELMALALLRFAEAPAAFRRGLAHTLAEEQTHLRLYLERMRALGVELGSQPLSGFFWRVMAPMPDPLDFVAHMALTFEQANLDFARHYAARLRAVGDEASAAILDRVHADEVGHVSLGRVWFERWRERGPSLLEAHRLALRSPITLRRARGLGFDRRGRRAAGLPEGYIERMACVEGSRGRPPVVHLFEPTAELTLAGARTPSKATRATTLDLELLPAFAARPEDLLLVRRAPSLEHLQQLAAAGLVVPETIAFEEGPVPVDAVPPRVAALQPWGWSPRVRGWLEPLRERADLPPPPAAADAILHAKTTWAQLRAPLQAELVEDWLDDGDALGGVARSQAEVDEWLASLRERWATVVIKAPYGTSGRNAQRIDARGPTAAQRGWVANTLARQGAVLLEPWLDRVCDLSLRITVDAAGAVRIDGLGRFLTDARGQYLGALLGPLTRVVPPAVARMLHGDGRDPERLDRVARVLARRVAAEVHRHGYAGPVGIDGLVYRDRRGALRLRPLVEVNVRPNLGHVVEGLTARIARGRAGLVVMLRAADLPAGQRFEAALARAREVLPLRTQGARPRLRQGVVPLTDPARAAAVVAVLVVAGSQAQARWALEVAAPAAAARIDGALRPATVDRSPPTP